jgi:hypothetical protein
MPREQRQRIQINTGNKVEKNRPGSYTRVKATVFNTDRSAGKLSSQRGRQRTPARQIKKEKIDGSGGLNQVSEAGVRKEVKIKKEPK